MCSQNALGHGQDTNRNRMNGFGEGGAAHYEPPVGVCQAAHLPLGMEGGYCNHRMRKEEMDICLEQGISQSSLPELVLGRPGGLLAFISLCSG